VSPVTQAHGRRPKLCVARFNAKNGDAGPKLLTKPGKEQKSDDTGWFFGSGNNAELEGVAVGAKGRRGKNRSCRPVSLPPDGTGKIRPLIRYNPAGTIRNKSFGGLLPSG